MSYYVCSDIHGRFDRYKKLLNTIQLSSNDTLFVLGDVIDRNPDGIAILLDMIARKNVVLFLGNHEWFLYNSISVHGETFVTNHYMKSIWCSSNNGGRPTMKAFQALDDDTKRLILRMIHNSILLKVLEINGVKYHLSHSFTLQNLESESYIYKDVSPQEAKDVVWKSIFRQGEYHADYKKFQKNLKYIVGHVPVQRISDKSNILKYHNIIDIDCGSAYSFLEKNSLACLRLDDMEEFYIE